MLAPTILCLAPLTLTAAANDADPEPPAKAVKPREVAVRGPLRGGRGSYERPTRIPTAKHLAEVAPTATLWNAILGKVDFRKEHLLLFAWTGSGTDRLVPVRGKAGEAAFEFVPGETKDDVPHTKLFAVPAGAKVKVTRR